MSMTFKKGDRAIWRRQERGGMRRITPIPVTIEKQTAVGYVVTWQRHGATQMAVAMASNLEIPEDDGA